MSPGTFAIGIQGKDQRMIKSATVPGKTPSVATTAAQDVVKWEERAQIAEARARESEAVLRRVEADIKRIEAEARLRDLMKAKAPG